LLCFKPANNKPVIDILAYYQPFITSSMITFSSPTFFNKKCCELKANCASFYHISASQQLRDNTLFLQIAILGIANVNFKPN